MLKYDAQFAAPGGTGAFHLLLRLLGGWCVLYVMNALISEKCHFIWTYQQCPEYTVTHMAETSVP